MSDTNLQQHLNDALDTKEISGKVEKIISDIRDLDFLVLQNYSKKFENNSKFRDESPVQVLGITMISLGRL